MQKIITATGKEFKIAWCGPSTIDYALRLEVVGSPMSEVLTTFTDPAETAELTHIFDGKKHVFSGYTKFKGVDMKPSGSIVVALLMEER